MAASYVSEVKDYYLKGLTPSYQFLSGHPLAPDWLKGDRIIYRHALLSGRIPVLVGKFQVRQVLTG